jgi:cephalosporin hydroxylase
MTTDTPDDHESFLAERRAAVQAMAADLPLRRQATEVFTAADRHDWSYQWNWLGLPMIQIPTDIVALQEIMWETKPDLVIETGIARGGSLVFFASMLQLLGEGRVIGIDVDVRAHNRRRIEGHPLAGRIEMIEGSSLDDQVVRAVRVAAEQARSVMVVLDSNHTHAHVLEELRSYAPLVTPGAYLVVSDTTLEDIPAQAHRPRPWGPGDNPRTAVDAYLAENPSFEVDDAMDAKLLLTSARRGYLRRRA